MTRVRRKQPVIDALYQAALTKLWKLEPSRYSEEDDPYVHSLLVGAMLHARRWELSRRAEPIEVAVREEQRAGRVTTRKPGLDAEAEAA